MRELIIAFGLFLFIEGILYALFPSKMKNILKNVEKLTVNQLRIGGLLFALIGGDTSLILSPDSDFFKFFGKSGIAPIQ